MEDEGPKLESDDHEQDDDEIGTTRLTSENYQAVANSRGQRRNGGGGGGGYRYRECLKNHAIAIGGQAVDGCGEFMPAGDEGTLEALKCAACDCHRNFHRKEPDVQHLQAANIHHHQQIVAPPAYYYHHHHHHHRPSGYLHVTNSPADHHHQRLLALPSTSREDLEEMSNPSSSGGGGSKKRFRTKFTQYQKDRMLPFAEALGWRIQNADEAVVQQFCAETGIKRKVLKVWMHNHKHTVGKKA